ncbi:unnamed protein product [Lactuca saligna]|uniref:Uncharacterized protein n=1 Tax=Lactuca saligna TaxID=75948 RepID=A0AA35Y957_LACSI|nr:unnamed protein product [Lactuca saligna]
MLCEGDTHLKDGEARAVLRTGGSLLAGSDWTNPRSNGKTTRAKGAGLRRARGVRGACEDRRKLYFHVDDKHLFVTSCLEFILELVAKYKGNNKDDVKCFTDVITWYIHVRKLLLSFIPKVYEVKK